MNDEHTLDGWRRDRISAAERGENPTVLTSMPSGFAVIGDTQFLPGYCLLLATPKVVHLTDLPMSRRLVFLRDMSIIGEAIQIVCRPRRVNYEIAGNREPFLHAHIIPRYSWEPAEYQSAPAAVYPSDVRNASDAAYHTDRHSTLKARLAQVIVELMSEDDTI